MYTKDKTQRITLRLNEEQFNFVKDSADVLGVSPSDFLRMVVNVSMSAGRVMDNKLQTAAQVVKTASNTEEGFRRENEKTNIDDIV